MSSKNVHEPPGDLEQGVGPTIASQVHITPFDGVSASGCVHVASPAHCCGRRSSAFGKPFVRLLQCEFTTRQRL